MLLEQSRSSFSRPSCLRSLRSVSPLDHADPIDLPGPRSATPQRNATDVPIVALAAKPIANICWLVTCAINAGEGGHYWAMGEMGTKCTISYEANSWYSLTGKALYRSCYTIGRCYILYLFKSERTNHIGHPQCAWRSTAPHVPNNRKLPDNKHLQQQAKPNSFGWRYLQLQHHIHYLSLGHAQTARRSITAPVMATGQPAQVAYCQIFTAQGAARPMLWLWRRYMLPSHLSITSAPPWRGSLPDQCAITVPTQIPS